MSCNGNNDNCACGCCSGIAVETPQAESNLPGLSAIAYRTGTWASFNASMLARLSSSDYPALSGLKTRDNDDFTIALLDATSVMLDILTFYQERLANESYLRTATQLFSLTQLGQLIGYQPSPGVSASAYLAFTLRAATGLPTDPTTSAITIPAGTQVQSVPAQGQTPQSFQTSADILAKPDWNALPVQTGAPWQPAATDTSAYLAGTATQLNPGDTILIVGATGASDPTTQPWVVGIVAGVQADGANQRTLVTWSQWGSSGTALTGVATFYAMRQRATLFGYNAINPQMLTAHVRAELGSLLTGTPPEWTFGTEGSAGTSLASQLLVDLDAVYSKVVPQSWMVAVARLDGGAATVIPFAVSTAISTSRSDYGLSAKVTRLGLVTPQDTIAAGFFKIAWEEYYNATRTTAALVQSDALPAAEQPLDYPLYGASLDLEVLRPDLVGVNAVAIVGKSQKLVVDPQVPPSTSLVFTPDDTTQSSVTLLPGQVYTILSPPDFFDNYGNIPSWRQATSSVTFAVADASGRTGSIDAPPSSFTLGIAASTDPVVQETAIVGQIVPATDSFPHTRILLQNKMLNCYDRTATVVNANVASATAGSPVTELLGNGSAATPNQQFTLKQTPLTYIQAPTQTGGQSSLAVTANGAAWTAVASLYQQPATAQVYATLNMPGGAAQIQFGGGVEGATLPTGQGNIQAQYRIGIGSAGNVAAGAITTLVDRPVGVSGVVNPLAATGGQDPQSVDDIRSNAPLTVLTLGRAVSITDYQNFAASYAGIAKAYALWIPNGANRGVFLTVAAAGGAYLPPGSQTLINLVSSLQKYGNPQIAIQAQSFLETTFGLAADLAYDPAYSVPAVQAAVLLQLQQTYSFANRDFGQGVSADEIAALIQGVAGVVAVNVTSLFTVTTSQAGDIGSGGFSLSKYNLWTSKAYIKLLHRPKDKQHLRICPYLPLASTGALPNPAEILVLDPNPLNVTLGAMA